MITTSPLRALATFAALLASACAHAPAANPATTPVAADDPDRVPFNADLRAAELRQLGGILREGYSHLAAKEAEWHLSLDGLLAKYEPLIRRAETFTRYELVMVSFVSELHDAHLGWRRTREAKEVRRRVSRLGLSTVFVGEALVVSEVWRGTAAERAGLRVGDRVLSIDGKEIAAAFDDYASLRAWSRRDAARYDFAGEWPARRYDDGTAPPERVLVVQRGAARIEVKVAPETKMPPDRVREEALSLSRQGAVTWLRLRSLRDLIDDKRMVSLGAELFAAPAGDKLGLVIDLRDNSGGYEHQARALAGVLAARPVEGASLRVKLTPAARSQHHEWRDLAEDPAQPGWSLPQPVRSEPRAPREYPGRIAVILDEGCRSSCETLALQLRALGARLFGSTTGGSSGAPVTYTLSWSKARVTVPAWEMVDGRGVPVEGHGVEPDEPVTATVEDLVAGRDAAGARASEWAARR